MMKDFFDFLRSNRVFAYGVIGPFIGLSFYVFHQAEYIKFLGDPVANTVYSAMLGCCIGMVYMFLLYSLARRFLHRDNYESVIKKIAILHAPFSVVALFPLQFEILSLHIPKLNESLFSVFIILFSVALANVFLPRNLFRYVVLLVKYAFAMMLFVILYKSIYFGALNYQTLELGWLNFKALTKVHDFIDIYLVITCGLLSLFFHRQDLKHAAQKETSVRKTQKSKAEEFCETHPKIARLFLVKTIAKAIYGNGLFFSAAVVLVFLLGFASYGYHLNTQNFRNDEFQVIGAAKGFLEEGNFRIWKWERCDDWNKTNQANRRHYTRAWPHTVLIAGSFKLFGISEASARIPSFIAGLLFLILVYGASFYFWQDRWCSLFTTLVFAFDPNLITLFRQARMYALLVGLSLLVFFLLVKWLSEPSNATYRPPWLNRFFKTYFNFNLKALVGIMLLLYLSFQIHINVLVLLPSLLVLVLWLLMTTRNRRYLLLATLGILCLPVVYFMATETTILKNLGYFVTYFEMEKYDYQKFFFAYPVGHKFNFTLYILGLGLCFFDPRKSRKIALVGLVITIEIALVFFILVADRYTSRNYVSHIIPFITLFNISVFVSLLTFYPKAIRVVLVSLLLLSVGSSYCHRFSSLYKGGNKVGKFSTAYKVIQENFDSKKQVIFGQFLRGYYFRDFPPDTKYISMGRKREYKLNQFVIDLNRHDAGWITWARYKQYNLDNYVLKFIKNSFERHYIAKTNVHVYYFDRNMMRDKLVHDVVSHKITGTFLAEGKMDKAFALGFETRYEMDLSQAHTIAFWIKYHFDKREAPIFLGHYKDGGISVESRKDLNDLGFRFRYAGSGKDHTLFTGPINDGKWHHLVWYQESGRQDATWGLFVDSKKQPLRTIREARDEIVHFATKTFQGQMEDLRIYDFALNQEQVNAIYNNGSGTLETILEVAEGDLKPVQHWKPYTENGQKELPKK